MAEDTMQKTPSRDTNRLRELRKASGVGLTELAAAVGRDVSTLVRYERGDSAIPDPIKRALATRYDVTIEYLMGWDG